MKTRKLIIVLALSVIAGMFGQAIAAVVEPNSVAMEKIELKLNLAKGQKYGTLTTIDQKMSQTVNGQPINVNQKFTMEINAEVLDVDANGISTVKITYSQIKMSMDGPGGLIEYDSTKPAVDSNNPQAQMMTDLWKSMVGMEIVMKLTPKGDIASIEGIEAMLEKMVEKMGSDDPNMAQSMKEMMKNFMGEDNLKEMNNGMFAGLPDGLVGVGDMWYDTMNLGTGFPIDLDVTYVLRDRKEGIAFIDMVSKIDMGDEKSSLIEMQGMKMNMQISGIQSGTFEVDETTGWSVRSSMDQKFSGVIKMPPSPQMPEGMTIPITIESKITAEPMGESIVND